MQHMHQGRRQPLGQACPGGECPFFSRASSPPGLEPLCVFSWDEKAMCRCGSIPPPPSLGELWCGLVEIHVRDECIGHTRQRPLHGKARAGWETDFYTPPVLGGAALLPFSAPAVYKNQGP